MDLSELGVLVETHSGHRRYLTSCLKSLREMRAPNIVCSYNSVFNHTQRRTLDEVMPTYDVLSLADMWMFSEFGQRVNGWLWLTKYGLALLSKGGKDQKPPKYIFGIEGDCIIQNPKGIHDIENKMVAEDTDICCAEYVPGEYAGAVSYLAKLEAITKIVDFMVDEAYKPLDPWGGGYGNIEARLGKAIKHLGIKCSEVRNPTHSHFSYGYRGTWGDCLGFRHIHGSEKWRMGTHHPPQPREWYDTRYLGAGELQALEYFWATKDTSKLQEMGYWQQTTPELIAQGIQYLETP